VDLNVHQTGGAILFRYDLPATTIVGRARHGMPAGRWPRRG